MPRWTWSVVLAKSSHGELLGIRKTGDLNVVVKNVCLRRTRSDERGGDKAGGKSYLEHGRPPISVSHDGPIKGGFGGACTKRLKVEA